MTFKDFKLDERLLEGIEAMGYENATPVQEQVIPPILAGKDIIASAQTGTGKTAAFLLPALVGAFLGSTTIRPGRVNVWGTLVGVAILAIGISGIQQFGGAFFVEPLFNGVTLLVSIGIAGWAQARRNASIRRRISERQLVQPPAADAAGGAAIPSALSPEHSPEHSHDAAPAASRHAA